MSGLKVNGIYMDAIAKKGFFVGTVSMLSGNDVSINNSELALHAQNDAAIQLKSLRVANAITGLKVDRNEQLQVLPSIAINNYTQSNITHPYVNEQHAQLFINGVLCNNVME